MANARRVAERMILERADRARRIGAELRALAMRLEAPSDPRESPENLKADAATLRAIAEQVERL